MAVPPPPMSDRPPSRRDLLRLLGAGTLGLAGCGPAWGPLALPGTTPGPPVRIPPAPPVGETPVGEVGVDALPRADAAASGPRPAPSPPRQRVLPQRLRRGGTVGLIAPAGVLTSRDQLRDATEALESLGFQTKVGRHVLARYGFLAGTDAQRAADLMAMVRDPEVDAIVAVRGGWGCARILPLLDYDEIAANPKPIVGYSDVTALLLAIYDRTGLVTFHGPVGVSTWSGITSGSFMRTLVDGIPPRLGPETRSTRDRTETVRSGVAEGPVVGGNLSVIAGLAGTGYLPDFDDHVVFFEEVGEDAYRLDRMLIQLELAGVIRRPAAVVFGQCSRCSSGGSSWTAEQAIRERLQTYPGPSFVGAPIGHASPVYTLPIGLAARVDAEAGTVDYLGPAVA